MPFDYEAGTLDATLGQPCRMCTPCDYQAGFVAAGGKLPFDTTKDGEQTVYVTSEVRDPAKPKWYTIIGMFPTEEAAKTFAASRELKTKVQSIVLLITGGVASVPEKKSGPFKTRSPLSSRETSSTASGSTGGGPSRSSSTRGTRWWSSAPAT